MSGLLRRIKRSRTADAGDPPAEQQAAGPEGANTTAETAPAGDEAKTSELPAATAPVIAADPDRPAGLDERAAAVPPPSGRRGRLRRRLRYLRRARELMLRDLGGLVYEVHRTGGADFGAHSGVIAGKVERLSALDAESGAIEQALGAPRSESVVFEPGVGGTCDVCGELYASAARFCSRCGTPTDPAARATETPAAEEQRPVPPMPKAPGTAETAVIAPATAAGAEARAKTGDEAAPATEAGPADEARTAEVKPGDESEAAAAADKNEPAAADEAKAAAPAEEFTWTDVKSGDEVKPADKDEPVAAAADEAEPAAPAEKPKPAEEAKPAEEKPKRRTRRPKAVKPPEGPAAEEPQPAGEPKDSEPRNPFGNIANGRPDDKASPPGLSSGDPLAARESRK